jgi:hypothetical protein
MRLEVLKLKKVEKLGILRKKTRRSRLTIPRESGKLKTNISLVIKDLHQPISLLKLLIVREVVKRKMTYLKLKLNYRESWRREIY